MASVISTTYQDQLQNPLLVSIIGLAYLSQYPPIYASCMTISGGRTEQHVIMGFGELAAVD